MYTMRKARKQHLNFVHKCQILSYLCLYLLVYCISYILAIFKRIICFFKYPSALRRSEWTPITVDATKHERGFIIESGDDAIFKNQNTLNMQIEALFRPHATLYIVC